MAGLFIATCSKAVAVQTIFRAYIRGDAMRIVKESEEEKRKREERREKEKETKDARLAPNFSTTRRRALKAHLLHVR